MNATSRQCFFVLSITKWEIPDDKTETDRKKNDDE